MACYEIIYDDGFGEARIATRQRVDAAAILAWAWAYEGLGHNALRDRPVAHKARDMVADFERLAPRLGIGTSRRISTGPNGSFVSLERVA